MSRMRPRLPIPAKLLLVSGGLLLLPWLSLRLLGELQRLALDVQQQALVATARRAAAALGDRPGLLLAAGAGPTRVLRILDLPGPVVVDGLADDWDRGGLETHRLPELAPEGEQPEGFSLAYRIGRQGNGVYLLVEVRDDAFVAPDPAGGLAPGDRLELWAVSADDELARFELDAPGDGPVSAWLVRPDGSRAPDNRVAGTWRTVEGGYQVELRLPRTLGARRLALAAVDVDDPVSREAVDRLASSGTAARDTLARVVTASPELGERLAELGGPRTRLWVVDAGKHVLGHVGSLEKTAETPGSEPAHTPAAVGRLVRRTVRRLVRLTGVGPPPLVEAAPRQPRSHEVDEALAGSPASRLRATGDGGTVVLSAAHPVRVDGRLVAAVLLQETATDVLAARGGSLDRILGTMLAVSLLGAAALFAFAGRLSLRARRLKAAVDELSEPSAAPAEAVPESGAGDEIGELARSVARMAARQREHARYLEQVGRRLAHELRTPIGVVRSSLDNLRLAALPEETRVYLDRADEGLRRLALMLSRLGEAARLEQALQATERESYDLVPVVRGSVEGYRAARPERAIRLREPGEPLGVSGSPDLLAQLLEKLIDNALGFALPGSAIEVELHRYGRTAALSVRNEGPPLPAAMAGRLFESMVSVRPPGAARDGEPHLGLGLYVVRLIAEFHGGSAAAHDRPDGRGVIVTVSLPLA